MAPPLTLETYNRIVYDTVHTQLVKFVPLFFFSLFPRFMRLCDNDVHVYGGM